MKKATKEAVLRELSAIAFSDFTEFVTLETDPEEGQVMIVKNTSLLKKESRRAVSSIKAGTRGIEIKLHDKLRALELLGRVNGVFSDNDAGEEDALNELKALLKTGADTDADS